MPNQIDVASLTMCRVSECGQCIHVGLQDTRAHETTLSLPTHCVQQLVMTLPHLLSRALQAQHGNDSVRAVFPLADWRLEAATASKDLILTLTTPDGFEVCFSLSPAVPAHISAALEDQEPDARPAKARLAS